MVKPNPDKDRSGDVSLPQDPIPARPVRITVPVSVASDLNALNSVIKESLGRLGCPACCSGRDILLELERDFVFDTDLQFSPNIATRSLANPLAASAPTPSVNLTLSRKAGSELDSVINAVGQLAGRLGCPDCCSGFDLHLRHSLDMVVNPAGRLSDVGFR